MKPPYLTRIAPKRKTNEIVFCYVRDFLYRVDGSGDGQEQYDGAYQDYKLTRISASDPREYRIEDVELSASSRFKIVYSSDGKTISRWYPTGTDNDYGANGEITADGAYTVYFRPDGDGEEGWFNRLICAELTSAQPTEPPTQAPTDAPDTEIIKRHSIATETYKVRDYADVIIENKDGKFSDALIALVKTMLNYGAAAQNQFSHNTVALANDGIGYELVRLSDDEISGITGGVPDKAAINALLTNSGIEYYGYSLILKTKTTLRFYFKKNGADTSQLALVNGDNQNIGTVKDYNDAYCYIEIEGIPAYELSDCYTLKYGDISLGSFSALSYVKDVLQNDNGAQSITDTVTALYRYHEAAKSFFDHPEPGQEETDIRPGS